MFQDRQLDKRFLELVHEGYLNRIKSKGTFVTRPKIAGDFIQKDPDI